MIGSGRQSNGEQDYINDSQDSSAPYQYSSDSGTTDISSILKSNDYSYLGQLPNLKFLQLTGLGISTATVMKSIGENDTNLQYAYVDSNKISDLSVFNNINMPNLKVLNLANNQISDISVIKTITLPALTTLDVSYNNIQDIGSISQASWPSLTSLYASYNQISDINSITRAGFPNIQKLVADNNQIQNVDAFKDSTFTKLKYLIVNNNQISNINIMTDLYSRYPDLQTFKISGNKIYDISFMNGYSLQSNTDANNQTYSQTVSRVKTTGNQSQNNTFDLPIKTSDFEGKNDGSGLYYGSADPTGSTLHISNISSNVASVVYYDGTTALAADVNSGKDNNTGIKSFVVSNTNGNTPITYQWSGAQGQFNGSGTVNVNLVDAVEPTITANDQNLTVGDHFDPKNGVTADDQQNDGSAKTDLTTKLVVKSNNVDTSKPGTYQVVYSVTNSYGLTATKTIKVVVTAASAQTPSSNSSTSSNGGTTPSSNNSASSNGGTTPSSNSSTSSNGGATSSSNSSTSSNGGTAPSSNNSTSGNGGTTPSSNSSTSTTTTAGQASSSESNFVGNVDTNSASIGAPDFRVNRYDNRQGGLLPMTSKLVQSYTVVYAVLAGIAASVMAIFVKMLRSHRN